MFCAPVSAADLSAYLVLTTDYVWRGVTQSDSHGAVQLGGDVAFDSGIYAGIWGSTIDIDHGPGRTRDTELNFYLGHNVDVGSKWTIGANVVAYRYPDQGDIVDYGYEELSLSANFNDRIWLEYAYSADLYNSGEQTHNVEFYAEGALGKRLIIGGGAGYYDVSNLVDDSYAYWQLGLTWPVKRFDFDLRYHDTSRWVPVLSSPDRADPRVVFSVRLSF